MRRSARGLVAVLTGALAQVSDAESKVILPHWNWLELHFDEAFDSYERALAVCADEPIDFIAGTRVR